MKKQELIICFLCGVLFSIGLIVSGMTQPQKVIGFLDFFGPGFDPSLMFVMVGAIAVYSLAFRYACKRGGPLFGQCYVLPTKNELDTKLILGSALFGIGWALGGFCPGPALASFASFSPSVFVFLLCMGIGMGVHEKFFQA
jgi:uncharacterized protein